MFKTTKAKVIAVVIFCMICISITVGLILYKNIEIDLNKIQKMVLNENILKVKDFSKVKYDIKELANQNNLKGVFINRILQKEEERLCTKEEAEQAIEIFINALK